MGGHSPSVLNYIDYITIASAGNATDFGDMLGAEADVGASSSGHGGLVANMPRAQEIYSQKVKKFDIILNLGLKC